MNKLAGLGEGYRAGARMGWGWILGGASPRTRPLFFVSPKKRGKRKATRAPRPSGALRFSKVRAVPEWRVGCAAA